jgi:hypothetical protein
MKKTPIQNFFKNSKSLKWFLDNYGEIEGGEDFIESYNLIFKIHMLFLLVR